MVKCGKGLHCVEPELEAVLGTKESKQPWRCQKKQQKKTKDKHGKLTRHKTVQKPGAKVKIFTIAKTIFGGGVLAMVILGGLIFFKNRNSRKAAQTEQVRLSTCSLDL